MQTPSIALFLGQHRVNRRGCIAEDSTATPITIGRYDGLSMQVCDRRHYVYEQYKEYKKESIKDRTQIHLAEDRT
jgi:hypothetical protein